MVLLLVLVRDEGGKFNRVIDVRGRLPNKWCQEIHKVFRLLVRWRHHEGRNWSKGIIRLVYLRYSIEQWRSASRAPKAVVERVKDDTRPLKFQ